MSADQLAGERATRVFLSYSRADSGRARALRDLLIAEGLDAFIDVEDIVKGEPWRERLGGLIAGADAVVFLISPASVASEICGWEINEAERLGKRVLPVVARPTPDEAVPGRLSRLNFTFLDADDLEAPQAMAEFAKLLAALRSDAGWVREHTRLGEAAGRWEAARRPHRLLLRGDELAAAEAWRDGRPAGAPEPTAAHLAWIAAGRKGVARRQRQWLGGASAVAIGAAALAAVALNQSLEAARQRSAAEAAAETARVERDGALLTQSRFLADLARQACEEGDGGRCLALALEAAPDPDAADPRPYAPEAEAALARGLGALFERRVFLDGGAPVRSLGLSPDGARLAVLFRTEHQTGRPPVASDGEVAGRAGLFDRRTGAVIAWLGDERPEGDGLSLDVDPASGRIAVGDRDGRLRLFDGATGALLQEIDTGFDHSLLSTRFAAGGGFAAVSSGVRARVFETRGWTEVALLDHRVATITDVALSSNGARAVVATSDGYATYYELEPGAVEDGRDAFSEARGARVLGREKGENNWATAAATGGAQAPWLFANGDGAITLPTVPLRLDAERGSIAALALRPDGGLLASAGAGGVTLWRTDLLRYDTDTARAALQNGARTLAGHVGGVRTVLWAPDGRLITGGQDGTVREWAAEPRFAPTALGDRAMFCVNTGGFALDGAVIAVGCGDGALKLWDAQTAELLWSAPPFADDLQPKIALSADGRRALALAANDSAARVYDLATRREVGRLADVGGAFAGGALDASGDRATLLTRDGAVLFWRVGSDAAPVRVQAHDERVSTVDISADGRFAATGDLTGSAKIWDVAKGALVAELGGHEAIVWRTVFSPAGDLAVTVSGGGDVRLWSTSDWREVRRLHGPGGDGPARAQFGAAFSPDGALVVATGLDGARVWRVADGAQVFVLPGGEIRAAAFRPDGARLALSGPGQAARVVETTGWRETAVFPLNVNISFAAWSLDGAQLLVEAPFATLLSPPRDVADAVMRARAAAPRCLTEAQRRAAFLEPAQPGWCAGLWPDISRVTPQTGAD